MVKIEIWGPDRSRGSNGGSPAIRRNKGNRNDIGSFRPGGLDGVVVVEGVGCGGTAGGGTADSDRIWIQVDGGIRGRGGIDAEGRASVV